MKALFVGIDVGHNGVKGSVAYITPDPLNDKAGIYLNSTKPVRLRLQSGALIREDLPETIPHWDAISDFFNSLPEDVKVVIVLEAVGDFSYRYERLYRRPNFEVWRVDNAILKKTRRFKRARYRVKTDIKDARDLIRVFYENYLIEKVKAHGVKIASATIDDEEEIELPIRAYRMNPKVDYDAWRDARTILRFYEQTKKGVIYWIQQVFAFFAKYSYDWPGLSVSNLTAPMIQRIEEVLSRHKDDPKVAFLLSKAPSIQNDVKTLRKLKTQIRRILQDHPDYPLLKGNLKGDKDPGWGDLFLAHLIFTYWDMDLYETFPQWMEYLGLTSILFRARTGNTIRYIANTRRRKNVKVAFYKMFRHHKTHPRIRAIYWYWVSEFFEGEVDHPYGKGLLRAIHYVAKRIFVALKTRTEFDIMKIDVEKLKRKRQEVKERKKEYRRKRRIEAIKRAKKRRRGWDQV